MKRTADADNVYLRVNRDLSDLLHNFNDEEQEAEGLMPLGFRPGSSHAEIPEIRRMPMPREDGYMDNPMELRTVDERPYGHTYFNKELERERIMEQNEDYRFVVLLAGAMNKSPIDLYREEDLEKVLRDREADRLRIRHELQRTIVPFQEKTKQRVELEARKRLVEADQAVFVNDQYDRLVNIGRYLLDGTLLTGVAVPARYGLARLELVRLDLEIILGRVALDNAAIIEGVASRESYVVAEFTETAEGATKQDLDTAKIIFPLAEDQRRAAFTAISLFHYFLDNKSSSVKRVVRANARAVATLAVPLSTILDRIDQPNPLRDTLPLVAESDGDDADGADFRVEKTGGISWDRLRDTETVNMPVFESLYTQAGVKLMVLQGLRNHYGKLQIRKVAYADIMEHFIYSSQEVAMQHGLSDIHLVNDQPDSVKTLLRVFLPSNNLTDDKMPLVQLLLRSHFLWHYFHARSTVGLALDWFNNGTKNGLPSNTRVVNSVEQLRLVVVKVKALLLAYFQIVIRLCDANRVPTVLGSGGGGGQSIFKFPVNMTVPDERQYVDTDTDRNAAKFDALNQLFLRTDPNTFITSTHFKQYVLTGKLPFASTVAPSFPNKAPTDQYVLDKYPIFHLHWLFDRYDRFVEHYREFLRQQMTEIEAALQAVQTILAEIAREENDNITRRNPHPFYDQRRAFTAQPINSGIIKLRASVTLFMNKAYHLIQDYCEGLRGLPQQAFQSQSAFDCGLEEAYACFIAALMAENQIIYPTGYKSLSSQRNILSHTGNEMARLKRFTFSRRGNDQYEITNVREQQHQQRKTLSQRYGQW